MHIYKFTKVLIILNENRWSTDRTPDLVGTWLVEIFMHPGLNQVHGLILGLVFQVGGLGLTGTRVMSPWLDTCHLPTPRPLPHDAILLHGTNHDFIFCWVGGWKIQRFMWCFRAPHPRFSDQFSANRQDGLKTASLVLFGNLIVRVNPRAFLETVQDPGYYKYGSTVLITP